MNGFFGNLFDFNHDGKLDSFERTADFVAFTSLMEDEEKKQNWKCRDQTLMSQNLWMLTKGVRLQKMLDQTQTIMIFDGGTEGA